MFACTPQSNSKLHKNCATLHLITVRIDDMIINDFCVQLPSNENVTLVSKYLWQLLQMETQH